MTTTDETGRILRRNGYTTMLADDGTACIADPLGRLVVLRLDVTEKSSAGKALVKALLQAINAYGAPLIRHDRNGSIAAIFQAEHGRVAALQDALLRPFAPEFRFKGEDAITTLTLGIDRFGIRTDGDWSDSRSPFNTVRRTLAVWPHDAEADLRDDLQAVFDQAHERGDIRWSHEDAAPQEPRVRFGELVYAGLNISERIEDRDRSLPPLSPEQEAEIRRQRIAAGLDKVVTRTHQPGYGY